MGTSIAVASSAEARSAADIACQALVKGYTHSGSSVREMHQYVECVERLHPPAEMPVPLIGKFCIAAVLLGVLLGALLNPNNRAVGAFEGFLLAAGGVILLTLVALLFS